MGLAHEKKSYLQEKANLFEIGSLFFNFCRDERTTAALPPAGKSGEYCNFHPDDQVRGPGSGRFFLEDQPPTG